MSKIGIMGGTFNPVHNGHITVAKAAMEQFELDEVLFITGGNPPHKKGLKMPDAHIRHKLVKLAVDGISGLVPCDYEVNKKTYSYTFETLQYLKKEYKDAQLYFIIGADSFCNIPDWYKPRTIMELCTLLVYERLGYDREADYKKIKKEYFCKVEFIDSPPVDISSSEIREKIAKGENVSQILNSDVLAFIERNGIYKPDELSLRGKIKQRLTKDRYSHSVAVAATAASLAKRYGIDEKKAYTAGLVHDCAKNLSNEKMLQKCHDYEVELDSFELENPALIHAKLGEKVARYELGITDEDILEAVKWHTVGKVGMGLLEKIIFVADMTEPTRKFKNLDMIRKKSWQNIDLAMQSCIKSTIRFNKEKNKPIHPNAFAVMKWLQTGEEECDNQE